GNVTAPIFRLDTPTGLTNSTFGNVPDLRAPISSTCTANPTNADGQTCQGGAAGTPFFLFPTGAPAAQKLFAEAAPPSDASSLTATDVTTSSATLNGSANPGGARTLTHFDFGATTAYGTSTSDSPIGPATTVIDFSVLADGLPNGTTIHFRGVA